MFAAFSVGKWVQDSCDELYEQIANRSRCPSVKNKIGFCTDGNYQNENAILKFFNKDCVNYGQVIKDKIDQKVIGSHVRKVLGSFDYNEIRINIVDGFCSALRERLKFSVRRAKTFAKKRKTISELLAIYQAYHNLIKDDNGKTPCVAEGLTSHIWNWGALLNTKIPVVL